MTAAVAVVIPAYRASKTLDAALASVAGQDLQPAEVVIVDDASGDDTPEVARRWADVLPVRVVGLAENGGPARARMKGIEACGSPLIALLDADDIWLPDHLRSLVRIYDERGGIVTADAYRWTPGGGIGSRTFRDTLPVPNTEQLQHLLRRNFIFVGSVFGRDAYEAAGRFRRGFDGAEDWDLWIRMVRVGARVHPAPGPTVLYRLSPSGLTGKADIVSRYRLVIERAVEEAASPEERRSATESLRRLKGKEHLARAHAAARSGRSEVARAAAREAWRGPVALRVEAAAVTVCPTLAVRTADLFRSRHWSGRWDAKASQRSW